MPKRQRQEGTAEELTSDALYGRTAISFKEMPIKYLRIIPSIRQCLGGLWVRI